MTALLVMAALAWLVLGRQAHEPLPSSPGTGKASESVDQIERRKGTANSDQPGGGQARSVAPGAQHLWPQVPVWGGDWVKHMDSMDEQEKRLLMRLHASYRGALSFRSEREQRYLMENGFPMPEEWLAAQKLSDELLKALWESGDRKAGYFYADRLLSRIEALQMQYSANPNEELGRELGRARILAAEEGVRGLSALGDSSPFAAYQLGRSDSAFNGSHEPMIAAMMLASDLGDIRALDLLNQFSRLQDLQGGASSPTLIYTFYASMRRDLLRNPVLRGLYLSIIDRNPYQ